MLLRQELTMFPTWLEKGEKPGRNILETLKKSEEQVYQDAKFFAALCRLEGDGNGEALFAKISNHGSPQP